MTNHEEVQQKNIYDQLSEKDLNRSLVLSQLFLLIIGLILSKILFPDVQWLLDILIWDFIDIFLWGTAIGMLVIILQIAVSRLLPREWMEDDGLNERLFRYKSTILVACISLCVACIEEFLFRGVIQTKFGLATAVVIFSLAHIRYFKKIALFCLLIVVSVLLGFLFEWTQNLWAVIFAHFLIDFILVLYMKREERIRGDCNGT